MISQLIEQAQAFLIMQQDSVLFVARESGETLIKQIDLPSLIRAMSQSDFQSGWYINPLMKLHHISQKEGRTTTINSILPSTYLLKFKSFCLGVPLPGVIIVHCQSQLRVYAYKDELNLSSTLLTITLYPTLTIVARSVGGNVALPRLNPSSMWNAFVTSEFNQDYDNRKSQAYPYNVVLSAKRSLPKLKYSLSRTRFGLDQSDFGCPGSN